MASEKFKKMIVTEGVTFIKDGEMPVCSIDGCDSKAAYKVECGNAVKYACKEHLGQAKTEMSADEGVDQDERVCSQDGPNDLNTTRLDTAAY